MIGLSCSYGLSKGENNVYEYEMTANTESVAHHRIGHCIKLPLQGDYLSTEAPKSDHSRVSRSRRGILATKKRRLAGGGRAFVLHGMDTS